MGLQLVDLVKELEGGSEMSLARRLGVKRQTLNRIARAPSLPVAALVVARLLAMLPEDVRGQQLAALAATPLPVKTVPARKKVTGRRSSYVAKTAEVGVDPTPAALRDRLKPAVGPKGGK